MRKSRSFQDKTKSIRINPTLPCSIRREIGICGKPADAAFAWPVENELVVTTDELLLTTPGLWMFQPICKECAEAMMLTVVWGINAPDKE